MRKPISNYEGYYEIDENGNVFSLDRDINFLSTNQTGQPFITAYKKLGKKINHLNCPKGYKKVKLCKKGFCKQFSIHRLVMETFIPNPENKREVNHINGVKSDNRLENLEWCTTSENRIHAFKTGLQVPTERQRLAAKKSIKYALLARGIILKEKETTI